MGLLVPVTMAGDDAVRFCCCCCCCGGGEEAFEAVDALARTRPPHMPQARASRGLWKVQEAQAQKRPSGLPGLLMLERAGLLAAGELLGSEASLDASASARCRADAV